jgi:SNF2 family DNA or RNA helicase
MAFVGELRPFQVEAVDRILERKAIVVAYEMGLGKTVLSIAVCEHLLENEIVREGLVVAPASLKYQWAKAIKQFTDNALVLVIDGPPKKREAQYAEAHKYEYVILNYEQVVNDWRHVRDLGRGFVVLDEATAIKSPTAARTKAVRKLTTDYRVALTGQPVENRPEEIYSLMEWVDSTVLGRFDIFDRTFIKRNHWGKVERYHNLPLLHELLSEAMVRKTKEDPDVAPYMPDVVEEVVYVDFDGKSKKIYDRIADDLSVALLAAGHVGSWDIAAHYGKADSMQDLGPLGDVMARVMCLTMACVNPHLLVISAENYLKTKDKTKTQQVGSAYAAELLEAGVLNDLPAVAPKVKEVVSTVKELVDASPKNKIVVFSFFRGQLEALEQALQAVGVKCVQFHGGMDAKEKDAAKTRFQLDSATKVFLSSDAGGYGVDLPQANYLINVDLPWSAGKWEQRNARIIRLASEFKSVTLLHLLMRGSVDERQYDMLESKKLIASAVVDGKGADRMGHLEVDLDTLSEFLGK